MELRVVARKPLPEVLMILRAQAGDHAGPVEARAAVVAAVEIGQVEFGSDFAVGDLRLRELGLETRAAGQHGEEAENGKGFFEHGDLSKAHDITTLGRT